MSRAVDLLSNGWSAHQAGDLGRAAAAYREALKLDPRHPDAYYLLGSVSLSLGDPAQAEACCRAAVMLRPDHARAFGNLGIALAALARSAEAEAAYREALRLKPDYAEALHNLGALLRSQGRLDEALHWHLAAQRARPAYAEAIDGAGIVLADLGRVDEAEAAFRQALALNPRFVAAHQNLGKLLRDRGRLDEALDCIERAIALDPGSAAAHHGRGVMLNECGDRTDPTGALDRAVSLRPDFAEARYSRALVRLLQGDFERGWADFDWRWKCPGAALPPLIQPLWDGQPAPDASILLYGDQGLGDTIQFIRYAKLVKQRVGRVIVACQPPLVKVLTACPGIDVLIPSDMRELPEFDLHFPLTSLPRLFKTTLETVPADVPYVFADPALVDLWRSELAVVSDFKVGIAWQGNPAFPGDRQRSIPLARFSAVARVPRVRLFSLQKGFGTEQLSGFAEREAITDLAPRLDEASGAFMDTAALLRCLDLLITSDSAIAHLAGALAVPAWVVLQYVPEWRWLLDRADSPWYPTVRLFRQSRPGDWDELFERIARSLCAAACTGS
jgi:tetratricopeptide (TPR) repeat protein